MLAFIVPLATVSAQTDETTVDKDQVELLIADKDNKRPDLSLDKIQTAEEMLLEAEEDLLFPADELYGSNWDSRWVDPYKADTAGIVFPDTCLVDFSAFFMPILKDSVKVTSPYGPRRRRMHKGIDLKVMIGDTIYAAFAGRVRICSFERRGYGNYLVIRHPNGLETIYGHLSKSLVQANEIVESGTPIALGGNTGRSTGSHLHFETRFLGHAINPADVIDFANGTPYKDAYVLRNIKLNERNSNIYTATDEQIIYHSVRSGETLSTIAQRYRTTVNELRALNGLSASAKLRIGQSLKCGIGKVAPSTDSKEGKTDEAAPAEKSAAKPSPAAPIASTNSGPIYYKVQAGDNLGSIARKYGVSVEQICKLNNISENTILKIGRAIRCS
jgi:murein DD-endopeptidase MepM/ murein hydrolase activator NlpD